jgi:hypothetical protein
MAGFCELVTGFQAPIFGIRRVRGILLFYDCACWRLHAVGRSGAVFEQQAGLGRKLALAVSEAAGLLDLCKWDLKCWDGATKG